MQVDETEAEALVADFVELFVDAVSNPEVARSLYRPPPSCRSGQADAVDSGTLTRRTPAP